MKLTAAVVSIDPSDSEIQHAAYLLWMDCGRPEAHDLEIWLAAKEMLSHENAPHAQSCRRAPEFSTSQLANPRADGILEVTIKSRGQAVTSSTRGAKILP